jgi:hypothetical protein
MSRWHAELTPPPPEGTDQYPPEYEIDMALLDARRGLDELEAEIRRRVTLEQRVIEVLRPLMDASRDACSSILLECHWPRVDALLADLEANK